MESIIREIYFGNVYESGKKAYVPITDAEADAYDKIRTLLEEDGIATFEKFIELLSLRNGDEMAHIYERGFLTGLHIGLEAGKYEP